MILPVNTDAGHWATALIGKPWQNGAQGPDAFDCWGFVRHVYQTQRGVVLPVLNINADQPLAIRHAIAGEKSSALWQPVAADALADFDVVLLSKAQHPDHVGVWASGALLHCIRVAGVVHQTRQSLRQSGWNLVACYRRAA